ncbi:MAG: porin family protein [Dysgonomonas sp.]
MQAQWQKQKVQNRPFADQRLYSFGFTVGIHAQDLILSHTGVQQANGEVWFAEIPSYSPGFSVGIIADRYLSQYFNIRTVPSLYFGDKKYVFREQSTGEEQRFNLRSNYLTVPIYIKFSAKRLNNIRPYMLAGAYVSTEIGSKKGQELRYNKTDYGLEIGIGCSIYLPMFKLSPELRFSFGLKDMINKDRSDLTDLDMMKYTQAISSGKSRMITLTFNFE